MYSFALVLALPWAMSVRAEYVQVTSELTIHYETSGHGDIAIVFIPGWTMTTEAFVHQLNHFEGSDRFRAIAYDPQGPGLFVEDGRGPHLSAARPRSGCPSRSART